MLKISSAVTLLSGSFFNMIFTKYFNFSFVFSGKAGYLVSTTKAKNSAVDILGSNQGLFFVISSYKTIPRDHISAL